MSFGPCLCGAFDCPSCGPLQGSRRCYLHNRYACESCEDWAEEHDGELPERDYDDWDDDE